MKSKIINISIIITAILCSFITAFAYSEYIAPKTGGNGGNNDGGLQMNFNYVNATPSASPATTNEFLNIINNAKTSSVTINCFVPGEDGYYYGSGVLLNELDG